MFTDPLFLVSAFFAVVLLGLAKGGFSGIGMAATPLLALTMPPLQALAIMLPILMMQDVISVWWYRHDWDGWNVKVMLPGAVIGTGLAWALAAVVPDNAVRLLIGAIGVLFVLNVWFGRMPPPRRPSTVSGVICGAGAAFTSTIASAGMPPFAIHVLPQRMEKMRFVGTVTMFFGRERDAARPLLRARAPHAREPHCVGCVDAACHRDEFPRLLAGQPDPDRAVLPHHLRADVLHFGGAAGAGRCRIVGSVALGARGCGMLLLRQLPPDVRQQIVRRPLRRRRDDIAGRT